NDSRHGFHVGVVGGSAQNFYARQRPILALNGSRNALGRGDSLERLLDTRGNGIKSSEHKARQFLPLLVRSFVGRFLCRFRRKPKSSFAFNFVTGVGQNRALGTRLARSSSIF